MTQNPKTWKTVIVFMILFCVVLIVFCIPFYSIRKEGYQIYEVREKTKEIQAIPEDSLEVAFFGDSESWAAILPKVLYDEYGIASYNFGTPGQCMYDTVCLAKEVLKKQNPKVVVVEASTLYSSPNPAKFLISQYVPIFHYHSFYRNESNGKNCVKELGANTTESVNAYTGTLDYMQANGSSNPLDTHSTTYLKELLELCKEKDITLEIISVPSALTWSQGKHDAVEAWCKTTQITYRDYNQKGFIDWSQDSRDGGDHLNLYGAKKVTQMVGKDFTEQEQIKAVEKDSPFAKWVSTLD